ncbi:MAG: hypothetical protein JJE04_25460 [Acidobacteriia bacterium]|nr:hypothetical protein [Terriglobia bacterium]
MALLDSLTPNERLLLLALLAGGLVVLAVMILLRLRMGPLEKERRRRLRLNMLGRLIDGQLNDVQENMVHYTYSVSGVAYHSSQDITHLRAMVPLDVAVLIGPVTLKYLPRNPFNSIVICEGWSGLRVRPKISTGDDSSSGSILPIPPQETNQNEAIV